MVAASGSFHGVVACFCYGIMSTSITLFNKAVFSHFKFTFPNFITSYQIAVSIVYMLALRSLGLAKLDRLPSQNLSKVLPLTILWWTYVVSGITALRYMSIPMFSVLRRSTTLLVMIGEFLILAKVPTWRSMAAITLMVSGAVLAGVNEVSFNLLGCFWVGICVISTAGYLILIKLQKETLGLSPFSLLFYNNVLALPIMISYMLSSSHEAAMVTSYPQFGSIVFQGFLLTSVSQAFLLNLCIFWCTTINSPLATTVTGQMKDLLTTALGMTLFEDGQLSGQMLYGVGIGLLGGVAYSILSYSDSRGRGAVEKVSLHEADALETEEREKLWIPQTLARSVQDKDLQIPVAPEEVSEEGYRLIKAHNPPKPTVLEARRDIF